MIPMHGRLKFLVSRLCHVSLCKIPTNVHFPMSHVVNSGQTTQTRNDIMDHPPQNTPLIFLSLHCMQPSF
ncbi:hypothetical protein XELAEV_18045007mg [Xenopus laevis]|uniref:Uncharacterized protein n=1 Tax=Xenopus laevis TaxID=8355 RepID=A0A974C055_XENLA|nr:hypothetical protein XELAEV_18045007mg [Xenopus laevis]